MKKGIKIDTSRLDADIRRQAKNITDFARMHDLSASTLQKIVRGTQSPTEAMLEKLCAATGRQRRYYAIRSETPAPRKAQRPLETPERNLIKLCNDNALLRIAKALERIAERVEKNG